MRILKLFNIFVGGTALSLPPSALLWDDGTPILWDDSDYVLWE